MDRTSLRVIFDTNIFISYLIALPGAQGVVQQLIDLAIGGDIVLILRDDLMGELRRTIDRKPHLKNAIPPEDADALWSILLTKGERLPHMSEQPERITRDPKDDYLLLAAILGNADYLVTGDRDLLDIRDDVKLTRIVTPVEFLELRTEQ